MGNARRRVTCCVTTPHVVRCGNVGSAGTLERPVAVDSGELVFGGKAWLWPDAGHRDVLWRASWSWLAVRCDRSARAARADQAARTGGAVAAIRADLSGR